ncbi:hypothetical protein ZIOFF_065276 [Zingiber officinale]|uniref:Uncharacterized protein n=1 Tax=Zingiber officinale TaxID=94328 RepID=A0A8J5KBD8_ZINOF|nr:hypothetical protein ZIOFF_065276 [Zingiber officinale]
MSSSSSCKRKEEGRMNLRFFCCLLFFILEDDAKGIGAFRVSIRDSVLARNNAPKLWLSRRQCTRFSTTAFGKCSKEPKGKIKSPILLYWHGKPRSCLLQFPQRHDARPSSRAWLSTHWCNPSKVQTNPSVGSCTWDPVSVFSSFASVDWVKVTDGEFFQTDSRSIMPFDGNACRACAICATVESDLFATMIATGLMVLSVFFFVFPLFLDGTRRFRVNLVGNFCKDREIIRRYFQCSTCRKRQVVNAIKSQPKLLSKIDEVAHGAWFPPWLATHANYYKELATTHWKEHGQPVLDVLLQKVSEKSIQAQQFMEPHFESSKVVSGQPMTIFSI